jgi:capsular polysaccharide biosynthesis protein
VSEQPLELKALLRGVWRGRVAIGALAVFGLGNGVAHEVLLPPEPIARALVIVPASGTADPAGTTEDDTPTQVIIATSNPVLATAGAAVSPPLSPTALRSHVKVSALSADVLQFDVTAPRGAEAEKLANAEVAGYIDYVNNANASSTRTAMSTLEKEAGSLSIQIQDLQSQINAVTARLASEGQGSAAGQRDASLVNSLQTEQEQVSLQLNNINSEMDTTELSGNVSGRAISVLQPAAIVPIPTLNYVYYPGIGAVGGLFAGCLLVLWRAQRDRRLRLRDELATAIGVPVFASVESPRCRSVEDWARLLWSYHPSPVDAWNFRRLLRNLPAAPDGRASLNVVVFADDGAAAAAAVQLARSVADLGVQTALVPRDHPALVLLRAACKRLGAPGTADDPFTFEAGSTNAEFSSAHLTVSIIAVDEAKPLVPATPGVSFLAVSSGFATTDSLARVALAATDADLPFEGILVVNPDPSDSTVGIVRLSGEARDLGTRTPRRTKAERTVGQRG